MSLTERLEAVQERADAAFNEADKCRVDHEGLSRTLGYMTSSASDVDSLLAALRAVLDLHKPRNGHDDCGHCVDPADAHWGIPWPCPTVRAISTALGEDES